MIEPRSSSHMDSSGISGTTVNFTKGNSFLLFPERIKDLAENNDRELLHRSVATQ